MLNNEVYFNTIVNKIKKVVERNKFSFTIEYLLYKQPLLDGITETEIRKAVNWGVNKGIINIKNKENLGNPEYSFSPNVVPEDKISDSVIVVSSPSLSNMTLGKIIERNNFINTTIAFKQIISSASKVIRIASPFFQQNIVHEDGFPELEELILLAYRRGCKIIVLSRETTSKRISDFNWLVNLSRDNGFTSKLEIFDYYIPNKEGLLASSVHAKLIIADEKIAYIGSAESRNNDIISGVKFRLF